MRDYMTLGPTPCEESCAQVGAENYYEQSHKEGRAYIAQLKRMFPHLDEHIEFRMKSFPHDFGSYMEVCCFYDDSREEQVAAMLEVEGNLPEFWDDEAKRELGLIQSAETFKSSDPDYVTGE